MSESWAGRNIQQDIHSGEERKRTVHMRNRSDIGQEEQEVLFCRTGIEYFMAHGRDRNYVENLLNGFSGVSH